jgi:putative membrane protein
MTAWLPAVPLALTALAYAAGVRRLSGRGDRWPRRRLLAALGALAAFAVALLPTLTAHDQDLSVHVVQHLMIALLAPGLLALSAPVTLALRAVRTPTRRRLLVVLHSRLVRLLTTPTVVVALDAGGMYAVYLTGLLERAEQEAWLHLLVHAHMIAAGCLLAWLVVGLDPLPARPGVAGRLLLLLAAGAAHDVLAKLLYQRGWGAAAEIMYYGGEALDVLLAVVVLAQWYARSGREVAHCARREAGSVGVRDTLAVRGTGRTMAEEGGEVPWGAMR